MIRIRIDENTILGLEETFVNEYGEQEYCVFEDTLISLPNRDILIPRNTKTIYTKTEDILYHHLLQKRTVIPTEASLIYYQFLKKIKVPFFKRLRKYLYSLRNCW